MIETRKRALQDSDGDSQTDEPRNGEDELPIPVYAMENRIKFDPEWSEDPDMNTWLIEKPNNTAFCVHCKCYLRIGSGKKDLLKHVKTAKHHRNVNSHNNDEDAEQKYDEEDSSEFCLFYLFLSLTKKFFQKKFTQEVESSIRFGKTTQSSKTGSSSNANQPFVKSAVFT